MYKRQGVSIQTPDELVQALKLDDLTFIQMPFNLLDYRWDELTDLIQVAKKHKKITVHVRSTLLQGLLINHNAEIWKQAHLNNTEDIFSWLEKYRKAFSCEDITDLCLRYVRGIPWIDGIVVGMESLEQLQANIHYFSTPALTTKQRQIMISSRPFICDKALNPSQWVHK